MGPNSLSVRWCACAFAARTDAVLSAPPQTAGVCSHEYVRNGIGCGAAVQGEAYCRLAASKQNTVPNFVPTLVQYW